MAGYHCLQRFNLVQGSVQKGYSVSLTSIMLVGQECMILRKESTFCENKTGGPIREVYANKCSGQ